MMESEHRTATLARAVDLETIDPAAVRVECINPDRYPRRWQMFQRAYRSSRLLTRFTLNRFRARPWEDVSTPASFVDPNAPHFYACGLDYATILRNAIDRDY